MRFLVVEDDEFVAQALKLLLVEQSYGVDLAPTGRLALEMVESFEYDLVILDLLLPDINGVHLCQQLRSQGHSVPILLLTGQNDVEQKAVALNAGADDYVVKPFDHRELLARVQALLRRGLGQPLPELTWGALQFDPSSRHVTYSGQEITLTPKEYAMLELFLRHSDRAFSAKLLLDRVWAAEDYPNEEAVRTHIKGLRQKLRQAGAPDDFIKTIHRVGYRLNPALNPELLALPQATCLIVVASKADQIGLQSVLRGETWLRPVWLRQYDDVLSNLVTHLPGLALFSYDLDPIASLNLCRHLRQSQRWQHLPVMFLLGQKTISAIQQVFEAGANEVIGQPLAGPELRTRMANQLRLADNSGAPMPPSCPTVSPCQSP
jgi:DNA-binding response OmpR family regulator